MPRTARSRYAAAAAFWCAAVSWVVLAPEVYGVPTLLVGLAIGATVCAAAVERDERIQQTIRLAWWAGCAAKADDRAQRIPRQGSVPAWPGTAEVRQPSI